MDRGTRRWVLAGAALAVVVIVTAGVLVLVSESSTGTAQRGGAGAGEVALDYLDAVARRDVRAAAALTDDPRAAESALSGALAGLGATAVRTVAEPPHGADGEREAARTFTITWTLGRDRVWTYDNTVTVLRGDEGWRVRWTPASLHPGSARARPCSCARWTELRGAGAGRRAAAGVEVRRGRARCGGRRAADAAARARSVRHRAARSGVVGGARRRGRVGHRHLDQHP
ncbi:NTF2-like N-terminal transpeptidase domain-containing protein [Prauserella oleivorans]